MLDMDPPVNNAGMSSALEHCISLQLRVTSRLDDMVSSRDRTSSVQSAAEHRALNIVRYVSTYSYTVSIPFLGLFGPVRLHSNTPIYLPHHFHNFHMLSSLAYVSVFICINVP
jgi:hypothetical protein